VNRRQESDHLLDTCSGLADALYDWWDARIPPIVYRARTSPSGRSLAFAATVGPEIVAARPLRDAIALHVYLVLRAGFTVPNQWLE
jgi:hypothetical protein